MSAVTSRFVYVSRKREDVIDSMTRGEFLALQLDKQDSLERPRKYSTFLLTRYPPRLKNYLVFIPLAGFIRTVYALIDWLLPGVFLRHHRHLLLSSFLPCLPLCELRKMQDEQPWCYKCWGLGHISRYCTASEKFAWCSGAHDSRTCIHRTPPSAAASTSCQDPPPKTDAKWKCAWSERVAWVRQAFDHPPQSCLCSLTYTYTCIIAPSCTILLYCFQPRSHTSVFTSKSS